MGGSAFGCMATGALGAGIETGRREELYGVAILPRVRTAEAIGFKSDDIKREITVEQT